MDDGSLACLNLPPDVTNKHFNCPETTQQNLVNLSFWVIDYIDGVKTKFGTDRMLVKIKIDGSETEKKFFTNSKEIKYILTKIRELNKFPRKVTLKASGTRFYLE